MDSINKREGQHGRQMGRGRRRNREEEGKEREN